MANIELVIKLDEEYIKQIDKIRFLIGGIEDRSLQINVINAIKNGTPLPKGHGDLVTKEQMIELVEFYQINPQHFNFVNLIDEIKDEKPIIEADKAESEEMND